MIKINDRLYRARARIARALANPTRLAIIDVLGREGPRCVCQLTEELGVSQSSVSKHLGVLREAGIVDSEKQGLNVCYSLKTPCIINFFDCLDQVLESELQEQTRILKGED